MDELARARSYMTNYHETKFEEAGLRQAVWAIIEYLEALEAQRETRTVGTKTLLDVTPDWLMETPAFTLPQMDQEGYVKLSPEQKETPPSSPATSPQEATPPGPNTSSKMFYLVKEDIPGQWRLMGTVTSAELNSLPDRGKALKDWQDLGWMLLTPSMWEWQWRSGQQGSTLGVQGAGQFVDTEAAGESVAASNAYVLIEEQS